MSIIDEGLPFAIHVYILEKTGAFYGEWLLVRLKQKQVSEYKAICHKDKHKFTLQLDGCNWHCHWTFNTCLIVSNFDSIFLYWRMNEENFFVGKYIQNCWFILWNNTIFFIYLTKSKTVILMWKYDLIALYFLPIIQHYNIILIVY